MSVSACSKKVFRPVIVMCVTMGMLLGCASLDYGVPSPLRTTKNASTGITQLNDGNPDSLVGGNGALTKTGKAEVGPIPQSSRPRSGIFGADKEKGGPERGELTLNVSDLPLPAFINEVFGNVLGKNFVISDPLKAKKDLVTLRVSEPQSAESLYRMASSVLKEYGVSIEANEALLTFVVLKGGAAGNEPPLLVTGKALPETPSSHRPVFYYHMLKVVSPNDARRWLTDAYGNTGLTVQSEANQSMLLLRGTLDAVRQASDALEYLDRPFMRGRISSRITPAFVDAPKLAAEIATILKAQGYDIRVGGLGGTIQLLPLTITNSMLVFANDKSSLALIERWVRELDQPRVESVGSTDNVGLYYYPVQNALAEEIMETVEPIIKTLTKHGGKDDGAEPVVIDKNQNALLLNVSPKEWVRILPVLKAMDKPTRQVMVEVTLASYKLTNNESYGADWSLNSEGGDSSRTLSLSSSGINYTVNKHGDSAALSALMGNSKVDI
ncbi:MAG: hypothetical protein KUG73_04340, partial [Pseudomonadales bacterium]|nr:hypothetical protein [Pseudomonadales bacterium]